MASWSKSSKTPSKEGSGTNREISNKILHFLRWQCERSFYSRVTLRDEIITDKSLEPVHLPMKYFKNVKELDLKGKIAKIMARIDVTNSTRGGV